jgi:hypothetical protein
MSSFAALVTVEDNKYSRFMSTLGISMFAIARYGVYIATTNMTGNAILCAAFPDKYSSSHPISPLVGAVGALLLPSLVVAIFLLPVTLLVCFCDLYDEELQGLAKVLRHESAFGGSQLKAYAWLFFNFLFHNMLGITLLSFSLKDVRYDVSRELVSGTLRVLFAAAAMGHHSVWLSNFGVLRFLAHLGLRALISGLSILSGHTSLVISAPLIYMTPSANASSLPSALLVGVIGGGILFCPCRAITSVFPSTLTQGQPGRRR